MKNFGIHTIIFMLLLTPGLMAEENKFSMALGGSVPVDTMEQENGRGGYVDFSYGLTPQFEILVHGAKLVDFEAENDLTEDELDISMVTIGGRYISEKINNMRGYIGFDMGVMGIDADNAKGDDNDTGGAARIHMGTEHYIFENSGLRLGASYNKGMGSVNELSFFDFNLGIFIRL